MMVTSLQLPLQSLSLDGMSAKSQSADSDTIQSLSFGEILKAKEKQLQQEQTINASSVAAALATLQTLSIMMPSIPDIETSDGIAKVDNQPGTQTNASALKSLQLGISTSMDGFSQIEANTIGITDQPVVPQTATQGSIPTELSVPDFNVPQNVPAKSLQSASRQSTSVENIQFIAAKSSGSETTLPLTNNHITNQTINTFTKPIVNTEATPMNLSGSAWAFSSDEVAKQFEKFVVSTKSIEPQINTVESNIENPSSIATTNVETENIPEQPEFQTLVNAQVPTQSLPGKSLQPQLGVKEGKLDRDAISRPLEAVNFHADEAALPKMNEEKVIDRVVFFPASQTETPADTAPLQPAPLQTEASQTILPFAPKQSEKFINTSARTDIANETPVQVNDSVIIPSTSGQEVQLHEAIPDQQSTAQPVTDNGITSLTSEQVTSSNLTSIRFSTVPTEVQQITTPLVAHQVENLTSISASTVRTSHATPIQQPATQLVRDEETVEHTTRQEVVPSETKGSNLDFEIPVSSLASSAKTTEPKVEKVVTQPFPQTETPVTNSLQPTNDPLPVRAEVDHVAEAKTDEIKIDKPAEPVSFSVIAAEVNQITEKNNAEPKPYLQQPEVMNSEPYLNMNREIEATVVDGSVQTNTSSASPVQSDMALPLSQAETKVSAETMAAEPLVIRNDETQQVQTTEQPHLYEQTTASSQTTINQETKSVEKQPVLHFEVINDPSSVLPETSLSNTSEVSREIVESRQTEINNDSTTTLKATVVINQKENVEKPFASKKETTLSTSIVDSKIDRLDIPSAAHSETIVANIAQVASKMSPEIVKANQGTLDGQVDGAGADKEGSFPTQNGEVETGSMLAKNTNIEPVVSQPDIQTNAVKEQTQTLGEPLITKELKVLQEASDSIKLVEQQQTEAVASVPEGSTIYANADKPVVSAKMFDLSTENTVVFDSTAEEVVTPSSTQFDLNTKASAKSTQEATPPELAQSKLTQTHLTASVVDTVQPESSLNNEATGSSATEPLSHPEDAAPNRSMFISNAMEKEELKLQHDETRQVPASIPQMNSANSNIKSANDDDLAGIQTTVSNTKETVTVAQPATNVVDAQMSIEQNDVTIGSKIVEPQTDKTASSADVSQSAIKFSATEKEPLSGNTNPGPAEIQSEVFANAEEPVINPDQPVIDAMQAHIDTKQQPILELKLNLSGVDRTKSTEIPQAKFEVSTNIDDLTIASIGNKASGVENRPALQSEKIVASSNEPGSGMMPTEIGVDQGNVSFETITVPSLDDLSQSSDEIGKVVDAAVFAPETNRSNELEVEGDHSAAQPDAGQTVSFRSTSDVPVPQAITNQKDLIPETQSEEPKAIPFEIAETVSWNSTNPVEQGNSNHTPVKVGHLANPVGTQKNLPETLVLDAQPVKSTSETVETKNVEKSVNVETATTEPLQNTENPAEKVETKASPDVANNKPGHGDANENVNNNRPSFVAASNIVPSPVALTSTSNGEDSASVQPGASIKVEAGKQILKNKLVISKDDEILPAEKQPKQNQTLESITATTGPVNETTSIGTNGKAPTNQINAQAAEVAQQVIRQMSIKIKDAPTSMHLQLNPKDLGNIDVEMVSTSQGVRVTFFAEQANTGKLLETQLGQLRESLIDSGVQLSSLNISQHGPSEQKGGFFSQGENFTQYTQNDIPRSAPSITETPPADRMIGSQGEVDYRI